MTKLLLAAHVIAAIVAVGPVTVAASMFPAAIRRAAEAAEAPDRSQAVATVRVLHRICRVYAALALAVPVLGFATASDMHVLGSAWVLASIALTGVAAAVLALMVLPAQQRLLAAFSALEAEAEAEAEVTRESAQSAQHDQRAETVRLGALTGTFNLLWASVTVLMILRPGSTTGV